MATGHPLRPAAPIGISPRHPIGFARAVNDWMKSDGRNQLLRELEGLDGPVFFERPMTLSFEDAHLASKMLTLRR
jgi:hypothetical protein